jgi:Zn-dependent protease with chaperone function
MFSNRFKVMVMALAGYLVVWFFALGCWSVVGLVGYLGYQGHVLNQGALKVMFLFSVLGVYFLRSLWIRRSVPEGLRVRREECPRLFEEIDLISAKLGAPPLYAVLIDASSNAGIVQYPVLGPLGWHRNYLILGYPLMALTPIEEWRALLTHELGHLSGRHGKFSAWIYRTYGTWQRLMAGNVAGGPVRWFFNFFFPRFEKLAFETVREHEYGADRSAGGLAGVDAAASMLARAGVIPRALVEDYWYRVWDQSRYLADPYSLRPFTDLNVASLLEGGSVPVMPYWIREELSQPTSDEDTHPSLQDRLLALGASERLHVSWKFGSEAAAWALVPTSVAQGIQSELDRTWQQDAAEEWAKQHSEHLRRREQIDLLLAKSERSLEEEQTVDYFLVADGRAAEALARGVTHEMLPGTRGLALLDLKDEACVEFLLAAVRQDVQWAPMILRRAQAFLLDRERVSEFEELREGVARYRQKSLAAGEERRSITGEHEFIPAELNSEWIAYFQKTLPSFSMWKRVWILEKKLAHFEGVEPVFLIALELRPWYRWAYGLGSTRRAASTAIDTLQQGLALPGPFFYYVVRGNDKLSDKVRAFPPFLEKR